MDATLIAAARETVTRAGAELAREHGYKTEDDGHAWAEYLRGITSTQHAHVVVLEYELSEALFGLGYLRACCAYRDAAARCACGRWYTVEQWEALDFVGEYDDGADGYELRNCICHSTLSRRVGGPL